jgi:hypothetical protein
MSTVNKKKTKKFIIKNMGENVKDVGNFHEAPHLHSRAT